MDQGPPIRISTGEVLCWAPFATPDKNADTCKALVSLACWDELPVPTLLTVSDEVQERRRHSEDYGRKHSTAPRKSQTRLPAHVPLLSKAPDIAKRIEVPIRAVS